MSANSSFNLASTNETISTTCDILSIPLYITRVILTPPLAVIILYLACQKWRKQGGWSAVSHCDVFTFHLAMMESFGVIGLAFILYGYYAGSRYMDRLGKTFFTIPYGGETFFHILTCMERYLAVARPHTYVGLRNARGVRIRNIIIACVWLLSFAWLAAMYLYYPRIPVVIVLSIMVPALVVVSFCSVYVLRALIRPKPGDGGQGKERVDQLKQKAFLTIMVILGALWMWFAGLLVAFAVYISPFLHPDLKCNVARSVSWFDAPLNLVLPLLYLQREGKLSFLFCKKGNHNARITK